MLWKQFQEISRTEDTARRSNDYRTRLAESVKIADSLRKLLRESVDSVAMDAAFKQAGQNCSAGHKRYRNE